MPFYDFLNSVKQGHYLQNFPKDIAQAVKQSLNNKVQTRDNHKVLLYNNKYNCVSEIPGFEIENSPNISGIRLVVRVFSYF